MSDYSRDRYVHIQWETRYPNILPYEYASSIYDALQPYPPLTVTFEEHHSNHPEFMAQCVFVPAGVPCEPNWYYNRQENTFLPPLFINYSHSNEYLVSQVHLFNLTSTRSGTFSLTGVKDGNVSTSAIIDNNKLKIRPNAIGTCSVELKFVADSGQETIANIYLNVVEELTPIVEPEILPDII